MKRIVAGLAAVVLAGSLSAVVVPPAPAAAACTIPLLCPPEPTPEPTPPPPPPEWNTPDPNDPANWSTDEFVAAAQARLAATKAVRFVGRNRSMNFLGDFRNVKITIDQTKKGKCETKQRASKKWKVIFRTVRKRQHIKAPTVWWTSLDYPVPLARKLSKRWVNVKASKSVRRGCVPLALMSPSLDYKDMPGDSGREINGRSVRDLQGTAPGVQTWFEVADDGGPVELLEFRTDDARYERSAKTPKVKRPKRSKRLKKVVKQWVRQQRR